MAERIDELESEYRRALAENAQPAGAQIQYNYHHHIGNSGSYGGCYTVEVPHVHDSSCYEQGRVKRTFKSADVTSYAHQSECWCGGSNVIWHVRYHETRWNAAGDVVFDGDSDAYNVVGHCGLDSRYTYDRAENVLNCNKTVDHYEPGCGKTENVTIESATIIYP